MDDVRFTVQAFNIKKGILMDLNKNVTANQVDRSIRRFSDYSSDLVDSDMNTFEDRLQQLMSFWEKDVVFSVIHNQLTSGDQSRFEKWLDERKSTVNGMVGSGVLKFPNDPDERASTMYWLLRQAYIDEVDVVNFAHSFYATRSNSISDRIQFFTESVVVPLEREMHYRLDDLQESLSTSSLSALSLSDLNIFPNHDSSELLVLQEQNVIDGTVNELDTVSVVAPNINQSLRFNAKSVADNARVFRESLRGNNRINVEFPEETKKLLAFLDFVEESTSELDGIIPENDSSGLPGDNPEIRSWMDQFWTHMRSNFNELLSPENVSGLAVPSTLILGMGAIGGMIGGPGGFAAGTLAGQLLSGHVKVGKVADEISNKLESD